MACSCGSTWRIESVDARNGITRALLHPMQFQVEKLLNKVGKGSFTLTTRDVLPRNIWPHLTTVVLQKLEGPDAPAVEWHGLIESFDASDNNTTTLGVNSIENWLSHRIMTDLSVTDMPQTDIGALLVNTAQFNPILAPFFPNQVPQQPGVPLYGVAAPSTIERQRNYDFSDKVPILQRCEELSQVINGPDWVTRTLRYGEEDSVALLDAAWNNMMLDTGFAELAATFNITREDISPQQGAWVSFMIWEDFTGGTVDTILASDREASGYSLTVDAQDHGNIAYGLGEGEGDDQVQSAAVDVNSIYPIYEVVGTWATVSRQRTLDEHTDGLLDESKEPIATPAATVPGVDPAVDLGDEVTFDLNFGALTYRGQSRVLGITWEQSADSPPMRTFATSPTDARSIINQFPDDDCEDC